MAVIERDVCRCGLHSIGVCVECGRGACGDHGNRSDGRFECHVCRTAARAASKPMPEKARQVLEAKARKQARRRGVEKGVVAVPWTLLTGYMTYEAVVLPTANFNNFFWPSFDPSWATVCVVYALLVLLIWRALFRYARRP
jgi:hypothetical protein